VSKDTPQQDWELREQKDTHLAGATHELVRSGDSITQLDLDIWGRLEAIAFVPRKDSDATYTFDKTELTQAIHALFASRLRSIVEHHPEIYYKHIVGLPAHYPTVKAVPVSVIEAEIKRMEEK
jgi:hypothetical protein